MSKIRVFSPANINLFLNVLKKRQDGFHEIASLMQAVNLRDEIEIERIPQGIKVVCNNPTVASDESNLAYRAAQLFLQATKVKSGVKIRIKKRIPVAAGLGGGSSDAASVLVGLNRLFATDISNRRWQGLAGKLGSDVPFFLSSGSTLATGRGEKLKTLSLPLNYWLVLVNPGFTVSTKWSYSRVKPKAMKQITYFRGKRPSFTRMLETIRANGNDLTAGVIRKFPEVKRIIEGLGKSGALYAAMSGSGPTVFGIFKDKSSASAAAIRLSRKKSWRTWVVKPVLMKH
jgi:4-diphosphocytidyl-2-C-methyl-D-erythritol kinase